MDEATLLLLSRYLDGDLSEEEQERFERRLAADEALAAELNRHRQLRQAVRQAVRSSAPPKRLDSLVEPLRIAPLQRPGVRPAVRWLAVAAAMVVGVTVAVEVARRQPGPEVPAEEPAVAAPAQPQPSRPRGYYQLQPLPKFVDESGEEKLGATDRLLATPHAEPELEQPEALEVIGPLPNRAEAKAAGIEDEPDAERDSDDGRGRRKPSEATLHERTLRRGEGDIAVTATGSLLAGEDFAGGRQGLGVLTLTGDASARSLRIRVDGRVPDGSYAMVLTILGGEVREIHGRDGARVMTGAGWQAVEAVLVGLPVRGVVDGQHPATLQVGAVASEGVGSLADRP